VYECQKFKNIALVWQLVSTGFYVNLLKINPYGNGEAKPFRGFKSLFKIYCEFSK
jgi:hypothetical protein